MLKRLSHRLSLLKNAANLEEQTVNLKHQLLTLESQLQECDQVNARHKKQLDELRSVAADSRETRDINALLSLFTELAEPIAELVYYTHQTGKTKRRSGSSEIIRDIHQAIHILEDHGMIMQGQPGQVTVYDSDIHSPIAATNTPAPGDSVIIEFPGFAFHEQIVLKAKVKKVVNNS